jgi:mono/diheme cytochrome c family protein
MKFFLLTIGACLPAALAAIAIPLQGAPPQTKSATVSGDAARGQAIFGERCAICHYDQSAAQKMGPGLKGIYARGQFANGRKVDNASMTAWIEKGGKDMPPLKDVLKPEEIRALVSYLRTL